MLLEGLGRTDKFDHKSFVYISWNSFGDSKTCYNKRTQKHIGLHAKASSSSKKI